MNKITILNRLLKENLISQEEFNILAENKFDYTKKEVEQHFLKTPSLPSIKTVKISTPSTIFISDVMTSSNLTNLSFEKEYIENNSDLLNQLNSSSNTNSI